ncbi:MAG TPA: LytTR family DNA-binding domain-containing protein [Spirochaetota bacterium]|nr:LytTR family DNA-binding domain-containing protein [Spirochaetota bacterium]
MICSDRNRKIISEMLASRGIEIDAGAEVSLIERGLASPDTGISVSFDPANLGGLFDFLDDMGLTALSKNDSDTIVGKQNEKESFEIIKLDAIYYFNADNNDTFCRTRSGVHEVRKKLYELEKNFYDRGFVRVNKSFLVNILMVSEIAPWFGGRLLLKFRDLDDEVEVSRKNVPSFKQYIDM